MERKKLEEMVSKVGSKFIEYIPEIVGNYLTYKGSIKIIEGLVTRNIRKMGEGAASFIGGKTLLDTKEKFANYFKKE